ncbi:MAG: hypothetical protein NW214_14190 [Pseudanabaenaceae cyanobacterium bins.39]|nr:hypothetical protein [Pseudanabaenaceae cyanobacterium bins.39]
MVVCHEVPQLNFTHPAIEFVISNFPAPNIPSGTDSSFTTDVYDVDKNKKIFLGISSSEKYNPSHFMVVDADDWVSKHIVQFVENNKDANGWYVDRGYDYRVDIDRITVRDNLHLRCGSTQILKYSLFCSSSLSNDISLDKIDINFWNHKEMHLRFHSEDKPIDALPFAGVVYVTNSGANLYWDEKLFLKSFKGNKNRWKYLFVMYFGKLKKIFFSKKLSAKLKDEFGLSNYSIREFLKVEK